MPFVPRGPGRGHRGRPGRVRRASTAPAWPSSTRAAAASTPAAPSAPTRTGRSSEGWLEGDAAVCPWHGFDFDLATGALPGRSRALGAGLLRAGARRQASRSTCRDGRDDPVRRCRGPARGHERRPGVFWKVLWEEGDRKAVLVRYTRARPIARHRHLGDEQIYVLEGSVTDDTGTCTAGNYARRPPGCVHTVRSEGGALVLAIMTRRHRAASVSHYHLQGVVRLARGCYAEDPSADVRHGIRGPRERRCVVTERAVKHVTKIPRRASAGPAQAAGAEPGAAGPALPAQRQVHR